MGARTRCRWGGPAFGWRSDGDVVKPLAMSATTRPVGSTANLHKVYRNLSSARPSIRPVSDIYGEDGQHYGWFGTGVPGGNSELHVANFTLGLLRKHATLNVNGEPVDSGWASHESWAAISSPGSSCGKDKRSCVPYHSSSSRSPKERLPASGELMKSCLVIVVVAIACEDSS